jgi:hypothetical protein
MAPGASVARVECARRREQRLEMDSIRRIAQYSIRVHKLRRAPP